MIEYENLSKVNQPWAQDLAKAAQDVISGGWYVLGKYVQKFEEEFANYNSSTYCIGVASGLDALILSLVAHELPPASEVILPSNTYIATILAVLHAGLVPILVEPDKKTYNIDPNLISAQITKKTRAMIIVHLYGKPCTMQPIVELCEKHDLILIEDCAQSHGAQYRKRKTGTFGKCGAFSFYPTKNLGALGDAGAITTDDSELADRLRKLRNYGSKTKYYNELIGYNSRLDEIQAAFLSIKLRHLDAINQHKRKLAAIYDANIGKQYIKPQSLPDHDDVFHIYPIRHERRDELRTYLSQAGVGTEIHYPVAPHCQEALDGIHSLAQATLDEDRFPISTELHRTILSLPISSFHTEQDVLQVCEHINAFSER